MIMMKTATADDGAISNNNGNGDAQRERKEKMTLTKKETIKQPAG